MIDRIGPPHKSSPMSDKSSGNLPRSDGRSDMAAASPTPHRSQQSAATRFHNELAVAVRSSTDVPTLWLLIVQTLMRHRDLVGAGVFQVIDNDVTPQHIQFDNPAINHKPVLDWISDSCRQAVESSTDTVGTCATIRNLSSAAVPLEGFDQSFVLVILIPNPTSERLNSEIAAVRSAAQHVSSFGRQRQLVQTTQQLSTTAALLDLCGRIETARDMSQATRILVDTLQTHLPTDIVAVGMCRAGRRTTRLSSVSGISDFDKASSRAGQLKAALDEAIVRGEPTLLDTDDQSPAARLLAHQQLLRSESHSVIITSPLTGPNDQTIGAIAVLGSESLNTQAARGLLNTIEVPVGGSLSIVQRAQRGVVRRSLHKVTSGIARPRTLAAAVLLIGLAAAMLIPLPYRIACRFTVAPIERRFSVAPFDGLLQETFAKQGDVIKAGELLAVMDDAEMRYELAGLVADGQRAGKERDVHLAERRVADSYMAALEADQIMSRRLLLTDRLEALRLESPIAGVILEGGSERQENYPVKVGQKLFEIAPLYRVRLDVEIPASEIDHVQPGMRVEFRAAGNRTKVRTGNIHSLRPRSEVLRNQNVFIAEIEFDNSDLELRPGTEGSARVISGKRTLGWNLFHRAWEHVVTEWLW